MLWTPLRSYKIKTPNLRLILQIKCQNYNTYLYIAVNVEEAARGHISVTKRNNKLVDTT